MGAQKLSITAILLAGGKGSRLKSSVPKQFLTLGGMPIAQYSLNLFLSMPEIADVIIVCNTEFQNFFKQGCHKPIRFAPPGNERQDSVSSGLKQASPDCNYVLIHDAARPFIQEDDVKKLISEGVPIGAAALGVPVKTTIKAVNAGLMVEQTLDRSSLYDIQTPQLLRRDILEKGLSQAENEKLIFTDDVSLAEFSGHPVKIVCGSEENLKITTLFDLKIADVLRPLP